VLLVKIKFREEGFMRELMIFLTFVTITVSAAYAKESSFTQEDRERLIRIEEGLKATNQRIEEGLKATNQRIEEGLKATNQRIDDLRDLSYVVIGGMLALIGFVLWDRRSALAPAIRKARELEEREERVERALKEIALKDANVKEALRHVGLLTD
jgi:sensor histidine kinase regulating citrate/malate metabolism